MNSSAHLALPWSMGHGSRRARVAAQERPFYEPLRALAVHLDLHRRERLRLVLVLETVNVVLGRKVAGSVCGLLQQVLDGVGVLLVRQTPEGNVGLSCGSRRLRLPIIERPAHFLIRELGQRLDPTVPHGFFTASPFDPLTAGVRDPQRRLIPEQRFGGFLPVHEFDKRPAESLYRRARRIVVGEAEPCRRGDTVPEVAGLATRLPKHRVDLFGKGHRGLRGGDAHRDG